MTMTIKIRAVLPTTAAATVATDLLPTACDGMDEESTTDALDGGFLNELVPCV